MSGQFRPRERLIEADVARRLNIGRAPLREAIRQLVAEGLLVKLHRRGTFVIDLTEQDVLEIQTIRLALEKLAVETLMDHVDSEELSALQEIVMKMNDSSQGGGDWGLGNFDMEFHEALCRLSGNRRLVSAWKLMDAQLQLFFAMDNRPVSGQEMAKTHQVLLDAIGSRDRQKAVAALADHIGDPTRMPSVLSTGHGQRRV